MWQAPLTEWQRDAQKSAESTPYYKGQEFSLHGFLQPFVKNKCAKLAIVKMGILNPKKRGDK